jgi:transcriptional regulator with XRE-family HTH domain
MTQKELAGATGISVKLIADYENDRVLPRKENKRLLLMALEGLRPEKSGAPPSPGEALEGDVEMPDRPVVPVDLERWRAFCDEAARIAGSRDAKILVAWRDENGLALIAATPENRLLTIRACAVPSTLDDVRSLRAVVDRLGEQLGVATP